MTVATHIRLHDDELGSVTVEYVVVLVLIAIVSISAWNAYEDAVNENVQSEYETFGYTES